MSPDASLPSSSSLTSEYREVNGVTLHVITAGPEDGPLVVLLHGFPDFWFGWRKQIPALVEAGFRVLVPDQRGYNLSDKPAGVRAYRISKLAGDVVALIRSEGRDSAHLVGHDWGGGVAWDCATRYPAMVDRLCVLNAPHPRVFATALATNPRQLLRSWYIFFFFIPLLPEWTLGRNRQATLELLLTDSSRPGIFHEGVMQYYHEAWSRNGALRSMIHWYRAMPLAGPLPPKTPVRAPTLICWGTDDTALRPELATQSLEFCEVGRLKRFERASHWVHVEEPTSVNEALCAHLEAEA